MTSRTPFNLTPKDLLYCKDILRKHSTTYYNSTKLFPKHIRPAVFALYSWVRQADELVDNPKTDPIKALVKHEKLFIKGIKDGKSPDRVTNIFLHLSKHYAFKTNWAKAFLSAMKLDLRKKHFYKTETDLKEYTYGSAQVIGLYMARIMGVSDEHLPAAKNLGEWMQLVNFLRDIKEDVIDRKRVYFPLNSLKAYNLNHNNLLSSDQYFQLRKFISNQAQDLINQTKLLTQQLNHIPKDCRPAVRLSLELYLWTLKKIKANPDIPIKKQLKPTKVTVLRYLLKVKLLSLTWK